MEQSLSIERILKELYHISGFRICIYDTNFHEIAAYPHELGCFCGLIDQKEGDCKRIFGIMGLGVKQGQEVILTFEGEDEEAAYEAVSKFMQENL